MAPDLARRLQEATFQAFGRVVDLAIEEQADFLLVAGDVYDSADRSLRAQIKFREALARAADHGVASYVAHGNHDPLSGWEAALTMPEAVHRFGGHGVEEVAVRRGGETLARIFGISYPVREVQENLAARFPKAPGGPFAIGVLHANVGGNPDYDNYAPCTLADLAAAGLDYWALGHIHARQVLREHSPAVVYPGNPQGRSWRELGERGCYLVKVDGAGSITLRFEPTDAVRWLRQRVEVGDLAGVDPLLEALYGLKEEVRRQADGRASLVRIELAGRGEVHGQLRREGGHDLAAILREGELARPDFVWVDRVEDATRPTLDLAQRRTFKDFVGDFLNAAAGLKEGPEPAAALRRLLTGQPAARQIGQELEKLSDADLLAILDEAETLGLDHLLPEGE